MTCPFWIAAVCSTPDTVKGYQQLCVTYTLNALNACLQACMKMQSWAQELWKTRAKPEALQLDTILAPAGTAANGHHHTTEINGSATADVTACQSLGLTNDHAVWTLLQNTQVALLGLHLHLLHGNLLRCWCGA